MKPKTIQSAAFRRNTLTVIAVMLFGLIVVGEITLAISIPWYLQSENAMALEVRRLNFRSSFDHVRNTVRGAKRISDTAQAELQLAGWAMDSLAPYLREHAGKLDSEELEQLQNTVNVLLHIANKAAVNHPASRAQKLDTGIYVNSIIPREKSK